MMIGMFFVKMRKEIVVLVVFKMILEVHDYHYTILLPISLSSLGIVQTT